MKKIVKDEAFRQAHWGKTVPFYVDPEKLRNHRFEPKGAYPATGTVSQFLDKQGFEITTVIRYDGEECRISVPAPVGFMP